MPRAARVWNQKPKTGKRFTDRFRKTATERGYDSRWSRYSKARLQEYPECVVCGDPADVTDHIQPVTGPDDPLFWDENNHQSLCYSDHSQKTASETNGKAIGRDNYKRKRVS